MKSTHATNFDHLSLRALRFVAMLTVVVALAASQVAASSVRLRAKANVASDKITLAHVAQLEGEQAQALAGLVIASFPTQQNELTIKLADVRKQLTETGVNWGMLSLRGFAHCQVVRLKRDEPAPVGRDQAVASNPQNEITLDSKLTLRAKVIETIHRLAEVDASELRISFGGRDQQILSQNVTTHRYEIQPSVSNVIGRVPVVIRQFEGQSLVDTFTIIADVKRKTQAVVVTRNISRSETFTPGSVELREVLLSDDRGQPVTDLAQVLGRDADAMLREGSVVYADDIKSPRLIKRGELITVRCHAGGLIVRTVARATQDGCMGEQITVRNDSTRQTFIAIVTGQREASTGIANNNASPTQTTGKLAATEAQL